MYFELLKAIRSVILSEKMRFVHILPEIRTPGNAYGCCRGGANLSNQEKGRGDANVSLAPLRSPIYRLLLYCKIRELQALHP
jgi:hypothetical protein